MEASLRISTKPRAPTSLIAFLAAAFQIPPLRSTNPFCHGASDAVKYCLMPCAEFAFEFTSQVRDQVIHGTCPAYPNHLKHRQDVDESGEFLDAEVPDIAAEPPNLEGDQYPRER